jgi:hypothetical protein
MGLQFVFTSSHAYGEESEFYTELKNLNKIDWKLLQSRNFKNDPEDPGKKGRYQAEALVHRHVPVEALLGIACCDSSIQTRLHNFAQQAGINLSIKTLSDWYFR